MTEVSAADKLTYVKSKIGEYADFPKKGIVFRWVCELIRFGICSRTRLHMFIFTSINGWSACSAYQLINIFTTLISDIFGALTDGKACLYLRDLLVRHIQDAYPEVELIVGLDSRGFLFNLLIATELGVGCAPIRKKGKLAGEVESVKYELEYGSVCNATSLTTLINTLLT